VARTLAQLQQRQRTIYPSPYRSHHVDVYVWFCVSLRACCVWCRRTLTSGYHCSAGLRTSYNFIRWPITPNPFWSTNPLVSLLSSLSLSLFLRPLVTPWIMSAYAARARVRGYNCTRFPAFLQTCGSGNKRGESNDKAFTREFVDEEYADSGQHAYYNVALLISVNLPVLSLFYVLPLTLSIYSKK